MPKKAECSEQPVRLLSGDRTMASVPSKSSRSLKSRPCGWATSGPPRGTQIHHMYGEAVSRGVAGSGAQSLTCVPKRSASASPSDTGREGRRPPHGENPARPPAAGAQRPSGTWPVSIFTRPSLSGRASRRRPAKPRTSLGLRDRRHRLLQTRASPDRPPRQRGQPAGRSSPPGVPAPAVWSRFQVRERTRDLSGCSMAPETERQTPPRSRRLGLYYFPLYFSISPGLRRRSAPGCLPLPLCS